MTQDAPQTRRERREGHDLHLLSQLVDKFGIVTALRVSLTQTEGTDTVRLGGVDTIQTEIEIISAYVGGLAGQCIEQREHETPAAYMGCSKQTVYQAVAVREKQVPAFSRKMCQRPQGIVGRTVVRIEGERQQFGLDRICAGCGANCPYISQPYPATENRFQIHVFLGVFKNKGQGA